MDRDPYEEEAPPEGRHIDTPEDWGTRVPEAGGPDDLGREGDWEPEAPTEEAD